MRGAAIGSLDVGLMPGAAVEGHENMACRPVWPDSSVVGVVRARMLSKGELPDCPRRPESFRCRR